jgi:hypothetical protein
VTISTSYKSTSVIVAIWVDNLIISGKDSVGVVVETTAQRGVRYEGYRELQDFFNFLDDLSSP